jgi:hypothetical protein
MKVKLKATSEIEAELRAAFPDTAFELTTTVIPDVGGAIVVMWKLGPSEEEVSAVTDTMRGEISIFHTRYEPCNSEEAKA